MEVDNKELPESKKFHDYRDEEAEDHGVVYSDAEDDYAPAEDDDDLPDLYRYLDALGTADSELDGPAQPPELFHPEAEHRHNYNNITLLKCEVEEEEVTPYVDEFDKGTQDDVLMVGKISLEEIQEEEKRLRDEHIAFQQQELDKEKKRKQELLRIEEETKRKVAKELKEKRRELARKVEIAKQKERLALDSLHKCFKRAENRLTTNLTRKGAEIKTMYGDLSMADGEYGGAKGRRWKLDWDRTPQPIQIKLKCLRGIKDKLPGGRYVMMVSLYNRLGGSVMKWSKLKGQQWGGATLPIIHNGNFYNFEMALNQSVFAVLPPRKALKPNMILVFELFLLRGAVVATDKVVSWGCFPICDNNMDTIQGLYKTPFLRGEIDSRIEKFTKIEELMASDLDHWMCNMYFEVIKLDKYLAGQKEFEVELQFTSDLLSHPDKLRELGVADDAKTPALYLQQSATDLKNDAIETGGVDNSEKAPVIRPDSATKPSVSVPVSNVGLAEISPTTAGPMTSGGTGSGVTGGPAEGRTVTSPDRPVTAADRPLSAGERPVTATGRPYSAAGGDTSEDKTSTDNSEIVHEAVDLLKARMSPEFRKRPMTTYGSRFAKREHKVHLDESESSDSEIDDDQIIFLREGNKDDMFRPVKGKPGMGYKRYLNEMSDMYDKKMYTLLPKTAVLKKKAEKRKLTYQEKLQRHSVSVKTEYRDQKKGEDRRHMEHVKRQAISELGLSDPKSREFWTMFVLFIMMFFVRIYVHYIGQWLYLTAQTIPINNLVVLPYTVQIMYHNTLLHTVEEILVVLVGPLSVFLIFVLGVLLCAACLWALGSFPGVGHKIIICLGLNAMLDPFFIAIVDAPLKSWDLPNLPSDSALADFSKLYWLFVRTEGLGLGGIFITLFLYMFTVFVSGAVLYMYFLRLNNNGRMLDSYWRLHAEASEIHIPYDLEISLPELDSICKKAEQWRGEEGERRKVSVYDYLWEEEYVDDLGELVNNKEKTTHLSIHTVHLDGLRELYRHFLVAPDGAILEVFGETAMVPEGEGRLKTAHYLGSQQSLNKVKGRQTVFTRAGFREETTLTADHASVVTTSSEETKASKAAEYLGKED